MPKGGGPECLLDSPSARLLILDVMGSLHCLALSDVAAPWSVSLVDDRHLTCHDDAHNPCGRRQGWVRCQSLDGAAVCSPPEGPVVASPSCSQRLSSESVPTSKSGSLVPPGLSSASVPSAHLASRSPTSESPLSLDQWVPVLPYSERGPPDEVDRRVHSGEDEGALCQAISWRWRGEADQTCMPPSTTVRERVAEWNRHCSPAERVFVTEEQSERYAVIDLDDGTLRWQGNEAGGEETGGRLSPSSLRFSSSEDAVPSDDASSLFSCTTSEERRTLSVLVSVGVTQLSSARGLFERGKQRHASHRHRSPTERRPTPRPLRLSSAAVSAVSINGSGVGRSARGSSSSSLANTGKPTSATEEGEEEEEEDDNDDGSPSSFVLRCSLDNRAHSLCHLVRGRGCVRSLPLRCGAGGEDHPPIVAACWVDGESGGVWRLPLCQERPVASAGEVRRPTSWLSTVWASGSPCLPRMLREYRILSAYGGGVGGSEGDEDSSFWGTFGFDREPLCLCGSPAALPSSAPSIARGGRRERCSSLSTNCESLTMVLRRSHPRPPPSHREERDDDDDEEEEEDEEEENESLRSRSLRESPTEKSSPSRSTSAELMVVPKRSCCPRPELSTDSSGHESTPSPTTSFFDEHFDPLLLLGRGAAGAALLVRHRMTGVFYAVKVLLARDYESEREILQEVRLHAMLDHKHLVRYYACWSELVTPKRAQQLAFIGLVKRRELLAIALSPKASHSQTRRQQRLCRHSSRWDERPEECGVLRVSNPMGWGNLKLDRADFDQRAVLIGEDSMTTTGTTDSAGGWEASTHRRGSRKGSFTFRRVQRIDSSCSDEESESDEESSDLDSDSSEGEANTSATLQQQQQHHRNGKTPTAVPPIVGSRAVFLQMELCQMTLAQFLATRQGIDRVENLVIALQLLDGLCYMHKGGILHRDIKPTNVFVDFRCQLVLDAHHSTGRAEDEDENEENEEEGGEDSGRSSASSKAGDRAGDDSVGAAHMRRLSRNHVSFVDGTDKGGSSISEDGGDSDGAEEREEEEEQEEKEEETAGSLCASLTLPPPPMSMALTKVLPRFSQAGLHGGVPRIGCGPSGSASCPSWSPPGWFAETGAQDTPLLLSSCSAAAHSDANRDELQQEAQPREDPLKCYEEQVLPMLMNTPHRSGAELLQQRLSFLVFQKEKWMARRTQRHKSARCYAAAHGRERAAVPAAMKRLWSAEGAQQLVGWLMEHLLQARLGDFGLAKPVHQPYCQRHHCHDDDGDGGGSALNGHCRRQDSPDDPSGCYCCGRDGAEAWKDAANTIGVGSPLYASPEQLAGGVQVDVASDVFSFGVVLAEMYIQPKTTSERLHILQAVRAGRFPTKEDIAVYPELVVARKLTRESSAKRIRLDQARALLKRALLDCVKQQMGSTL